MAIVELSSQGHNWNELWNMTPRAINALLLLDGDRRKRHQAEYLALTALATQGEEKKIIDQIRAFERVS